jgi:hypothetical protein
MTMTLCMTRSNSIHLRISTFLLVVLLACAARAATDPHAQATPPGVAIVTSASGAATVTNGEKQESITMGMDLAEGAVLRVESGTVALVFAAGDYLELKAGESLTLGKDAASSTISGASGTRGVDAQETVDVGAEGVRPSDAGDHIYAVADASGIRGDMMAIAVAPRLVVSESNPVFCWFDSDSAAAGKEKRYVLIIADDKGAVVLREEVSGRAWEMNAVPLDRLGADLPRTALAHYTWGVFEKKSSPSAPSALDAAFVFADSSTLRHADEKRATVLGLHERGKVDDHSLHMLLALYYLDDRERLFADALPHLLALAGTPAGRSYADAQIVGILKRFGNQTSVAAEYFLRRR